MVSITDIGSSAVQPSPGKETGFVEEPPMLVLASFRLLIARRTPPTASGAGEPAVMTMIPPSGGGASVSCEQALIAKTSSERVNTRTLQRAITYPPSTPRHLGGGRVTTFSCS